MLESRRFEADRLLHEGVAQTEVARRLGVSPSAVCQWRAAARVRGASALRAVRRVGRTSAVSRGIQSGLAQLLALDARKRGYPTRQWTLARIAEVTGRRWGYRYTRGGIWHVLRKHGFRWQSPRGARIGSSIPRAGGAEGAGQWAPGVRVLFLVAGRGTKLRRRIAAPAPRT